MRAIPFYCPLIRTVVKNIIVDFEIAPHIGIQAFSSTCHDEYPTSSMSWMTPLTKLSTNAASSG
ncbi:hypothetical protein N7530_002998 [Penicillium desertorum]|uniref:Uncharacterized protein n=1 Tax=Penicillium desertorum TaxID=1303715 RepID=A0A9W9X4J6_9EURO|nr:hypothetical protein N7530_002998 [Penicillium desertorum]